MKLDTRHNIEQLQHVVPSGQPLQSGKSLDEISPTLLQQYIKHTFEPGDQLKPAKIEVNGRKNRRFVVVLGEDCRQMRILDLDFRAGDEKAGRAEQGAKDDGDDEMVDS